MAELVGFLNQEARDLVAQGCSYVQLDSLRYTQWMNSARRQAMFDAGLDLDKELDEQIRWDNASIAGIRGTPGVVVGHHICRGNNRSAWSGEGGYEQVAEKLFAGMNVDRFLLEYDTDRAGGFEPLRFVPKDKIVVLGLVSTKSSDMETVDELKRRIDQASRYLPLDQLALSPQCGFGGIDSKVLSENEMWTKLDTIVETATQVWA
jgi:5-methyltetrahydropteroyltriglutamate--homocysteine methyltransferase